MQHDEDGSFFEKGTVALKQNTEAAFDSIKSIGLSQDYAAAVTLNRGASTVPRSVAASAVISSRDSGA